MNPWKWQDRASCKNMPLVLFFGTEDERYDQDAKDRREARARAVCASCPVSRECHEGAQERGEYGIWAGLDREQRAAQRRNARRRGEAA